MICSMTDEQMLEVWRPYPGFEGRYEVSNYGTVRNMLSQVIRVPNPNRRYPSIQISGREHKIHQAVARAFLGEPTGPLVRHLDDDPWNNFVGNLAYGTDHDNALDAVRNGVHGSARKTRCPKGHEYTSENTYINAASGSRMCRSCESVRVRQPRSAPARENKRAYDRERIAKIRSTK